MSYLHYEHKITGRENNSNNVYMTKQKTSFFCLKGLCG